MLAVAVLLLVADLPGVVTRIGPPDPVAHLGPGGLELSPDGRRLAVRVQVTPPRFVEHAPPRVGGTVIPAESGVDVVDLDAGRVVARLRDPERLREPTWHGFLARLAVAFTPDGKQVLTSNSDRVWVWDLATGKPVRSIVGPEKSDYYDSSKKMPAQVVALRGLQRADWVMAQADTGGACRLDVAAGTWARCGGAEHLLGVSPDGRWVALSTGAASIENYVGLCDTRTGKDVLDTSIEDKWSRYPRDHTPSPDGKYVAVAEDDRGVLLFDVPTRRPVELERAGGKAYTVRELAFTPDNTQLLALNAAPYKGGGRPHIARWDVASRERLADWPLPADPADVAVDHRNNRLILAAGGALYRVALPPPKR